MIGKNISHYRITEKLGRGGMGEVYRARDTKLARDVAIKILPDAFADDTDRVARFTREAQTLAALNHPNIAQIYGIIETPFLPEAGADDVHVHALLMELVEGEDLAQRLGRGAVPLDETLPIAQQIAEVLDRRFTNASPAFQRTYDVTRDNRFLGLIEAAVVKQSAVPTSQVFVVLNWFEELKRLCPPERSRQD